MKVILAMVIAAEKTGHRIRTFSLALEVGCMQDCFFQKNTLLVKDIVFSSHMKCVSGFDGTESVHTSDFYHLLCVLG